MFFHSIIHRECVRNVKDWVLVQTVDVKTLIDRTKSLNEGAIQFPTFQPGGWRLTRYTQSGYFDNDKKLEDFTAKEWEILLFAAEHKPKHPDKSWGKTVKYEGVIPGLKKHFLKKIPERTLQERMPYAMW